MSILFSSDYHIGTNRYSHTTVESRKRLKRELFKAALGANTRFGTEYRVCLGDLFDTFSNTENDIAEGHVVYHALDLCLAGNHDMSNNADKMGSLELLEDTTNDKRRLVVSRIGEPMFHVERRPEADLYAVPHHASQAEFETALEKAMEAVPETSPKPATLLLHCNYNLSDTLATDTSLNLTEDDVKLLLEEFDYIIMGHEHTPAEYFDGRLLIVGNTFPTSFGDISDKRVLTFDGKKMESHKIWDASSGYKELPVEQFMHTPDVIFPESIRFIKITGTILPEQVKEVAKQMKQLWALNPSLLMVGNFTDIVSQVSKGALDFVAEETHLTLPEKIDRALKDSPLYPLWSEIYKSLSVEGETK